MQADCSRAQHLCSLTAVQRLRTAVAPQVLVVLLQAAMSARRFQGVLSLHHLLPLRLVLLLHSMSSRHLQQQCMLLLAQLHLLRLLKRVLQQQQLLMARQRPQLQLSTRQQQKQQMKKCQTAAANLVSMPPVAQQMQRQQQHHQQQQRAQLQDLLSVSHVHHLLTHLLPSQPTALMLLPAFGRSSQQQQQ